MPDPAKPVRNQEFLARMRDGWLPFGWHAHPAYDGHRPLLDFEGEDEAGMPEWERPHGWVSERERIESIGLEGLRRFHPSLAAEVAADMSHDASHPCRGCGAKFFEHPTDTCAYWY